MNNITRKEEPSRAHRLRFPAFPVAGLAGSSFKHEYLGRHSGGRLARGILRGSCGERPWAPEARRRIEHWRLWS